MGKGSKERRRRRRQQRHDARVQSGSLIEVFWEGAIIRVKPNVAEVADQFQTIRLAAAVHGLDVVASIAQSRLTSTLHVQFVSLVTSCHVLHWWPGNGTWTKATGERGTETDWREVVKLAAIPADP